MLMHQNRLWWAFLTVIAAISMWYFADASIKIWKFYQLDRKTPVENISWKVDRRADEDYVVLASFSYSLRGVPYTKENLVISPPFKNPYVAEKALAEARQQPHEAWIAMDHPDMVAFEKHFPYKELLSSFVLLALFAYFLWLGHFVARYNP